MSMIAAKRKPKVLHMGYNFNPSEVGRGGVIVYQWSVMKAVAEAGWDVSFFMGAKHTLSKKTKTLTYFKDGVKIIELINSPRRHLDFSCDPLEHTSNQTIEAITERVLEEEKPDLVHIHDPRLFTFSVVDVIKKKKIPALKTIHNYFDLCPQGEMMFKGTEICTDYLEGSRCGECLSALPLESFMKERLSNTLRGTIFHPLLKRSWRLLIKFMGKPKNTVPGPLPFPAEHYRGRRQYSMERLRMLDAVHCYSRRTAEILIRHGLDENKVSLIPISSDSLDNIRPKPLRTKQYPVVFGYLTGKSYIKGYEVLLDAFARLDQKKAKLLAYGFDEPRHFSEKYGHLNAEFHSSYDPARLNEIMSKVDVGLVPSIWEEVFGIVGIEFLAAGIPVIGSNAGGIPEWLNEGENGFLFKMGDSQDMFRKMEMFIKDPELISRLQKNIRPWKSMKVHAREILDAYERVLLNRR